MSFEGHSLLTAERSLEGTAASSGENVAIRVCGVSKCYHLYDKPQDRLRQSIYPRLQRMCGRTVRQYAREFWALRDISFEVRKGETVGIIGRNGSGKSTLLQIIAGTLEPTQGEVTVNGRVAALLELGSGFNPEFTGRENVYTNAAILGLSRAEIDGRFDDIAAFADIGDFIEQPIKTYSSGMMVRLAFAVQVAIEPDVLIIDEALAVGDMRFTMKCIRRMRELVEKGTSCLFVTHDMSSVVNFCSEALWLQDGHILQSGDPKSVTLNYANFMMYGFLPALTEALKRDVNDAVSSLSETTERSGEVDRRRMFESLSWVDTSHLPSTGLGGATIVQLALRKEGDNTAASIFSGGEQAELFLRITSAQRLTSPIVCADFRDSKGNLIFGLNTHFMNEPMPELHVDGYLVLKFGFRMPLLLKGDYGLSVAVADGDAQSHDQHHIINEALVIHIVPTDKRQSHYMVVNENCDCEVLCYSNKA
jgi:lipopolysaccharide transport system ATP-binding protein